MTEEHVEQTEEVPQEVQPEAEPQEGEETRKFVEMDEETQKRFNRIYGNMKQYERMMEQMAQDNRRLFDKLQHLESSQVQRVSGELINNLRNEKTRALEAGDFKRANQIDDQIDAAKEATQKKQQELSQQPPPQEPESDSLFSPEDEAKIRAWAFESDAQGNPRRPWANPSHPLFQKAMNFAAGVMEDPNFDNSIETAMREVERLMGGFSTGNGASPVLSGDQNLRQRPKKNKLTKDQMLVADAMGLSHEEYAKGLE